VLFNLTTQNDTTHGDWSNDPYLGDAKITRFFDSSRHDNWWQAAATVTADLGFAELKSATAYFARHMTYTEDNATYEQYKAKYYGSYYGTAPATPKQAHDLVPKYNVYDTRLLSNNNFTTSTIFNDQHQYRISQEFRLTSKGDSKLQWLGGLFYERVHDYWYFGTQNLQLMDTYAWKYANSVACDPANVAQGVQCPLAPTTSIYAQWFDRTVTQTAVFGEISYKFTDPWTVTVGGRWFNYKRDTFQHYDQPLGLPVELGAPGSSASSGNDSATLYKVGTQYKYSPDGMVYLLFSEGYRLGGENNTRAAATGDVPLKYNPDKLLNYEAGIKSQWWDRRLTLNASLFYMKWSQIQLESTTGAFWKHGTLNGGGADNLGIELSGALRATKQLTLDYNLISANPKLTEQVVYPNGRTIPAGTQMVGAPKFKASAGLEYSFGWKPMGGDLWARFDYSYQSLEYQSLLYASAAYQNEFHNAGYPPGAGRVEPWSFGKLQVGVNMPSKLELTLTLDNVWNSKGANYVTTSETYYAASFQDPRYHMMPAQFRPQNIGLTIRKNF
jgi:iron complex outermembrane recepter protein